MERHVPVAPAAALAFSKAAAARDTALGSPTPCPPGDPLVHNASPAFLALSVQETAKRDPSVQEYVSDSPLVYSAEQLSPECEPGISGVSDYNSHNTSHERKETLSARRFSTPQRYVPGP